MRTAPIVIFDIKIGNILVLYTVYNIHYIVYKHQKMCINCA